MLAVAADALGRDRVQAVMMPSPYTRSISVEDAREMAAIVDVEYSELRIEPMFEAFRVALADEFKGCRRMPRRRTSRRASAALC